MIKIVVLTGGPCAGKTTALSRIARRFGNAGWMVLIIPEMATLVMEGGIQPGIPGYDFQSDLLGLQLNMEQVYRGYAEKLSAEGKKVLIILDRGIMDSKAYADPFLWTATLAKFGLDEVSARDTRSDAVIHLVSAAIGAPAYYTLETNKQRKEDVNAAAAADRRTLASWIGHPHLRVIDNTTTFEEKIGRVLKEIANVLGEPVPIEKERRFLVEQIAEPPTDSVEFSIFQHYLDIDPSHVVRIRRRGMNNSWLFTRTVKLPTPDGDGRFEMEEIVSPRDYSRLLRETPNAPFVEKMRRCFVWESLYLELDRIIHPAKNLTILEIETDEKGTLPIPPFLRVIREITGDIEFSNLSLALTASRT